MTAPTRSEPQLEFFPDEHEYRLDGIKIPSVTQILSFGQDLSRIPPWTAQRGTALHLATEYLDAGDLDEDSVDPLVRPHLDAYKNWKADNGHFHFLRTEYKVWGEIDTLKFAGTIDRVLYVDHGVTGSEHVAILDIKSGAPRKEHEAQLAAYARAYYQRHEPDVDVIYLAGIYCDKNGEFEEKRYDRRNGELAFIEKLRAYYAAQGVEDERQQAKVGE